MVAGYVKTDPTGEIGATVALERFLNLPSSIARTRTAVGGGRIPPYSSFPARAPYAATVVSQVVCSLKCIPKRFSSLVS